MRRVQVFASTAIGFTEKKCVTGLGGIMRMGIVLFCTSNCSTLRKHSRVRASAARPGSFVNCVTRSTCIPSPIPPPVLGV